MKLKKLDALGKPYVIYAEVLEPSAIEQFVDVMSHPEITQGALMPDAHTGYTLPIGGVVASKESIFPGFVGYDIGCGMLASPLNFNLSDIREHQDEIFETIYKFIPVGPKRNKKNAHWDHSHLQSTSVLKKIFDKDGLLQCGTLGGGNHFIEIAHDENDNVWVVIHSGSRNLGHKVASHYMALAKQDSIDVAQIEQEFKQRNKDFLAHNKAGYEKAKIKFVQSRKEKLTKGSNEGIFGFKANSKNGKDYLMDMEFCLEFALANRKEMLLRVEQAIHFVLGNKVNDNAFLSNIINRNHNHAEHVEGIGYIHRKGATQAHKGMKGVIPGNMKDGSFVVVGKGNSDSLLSSSHGAGRVMSRGKAKEMIVLDDFAQAMVGIKAKVGESTKDESPFAYKNIHEVMTLQQDLVEVVAHLKPVINIKA